MEEKIKEVIEAYKKDLERITEEEIYKWRSIKWFKDNWDIEADDFEEMLTISLKKTANLLQSSNYYARNRILQYAKDEPNTVRKLFTALFDEAVTLEKRYEDFRNGLGELAEQYSDDNLKKHHQDLHAVSLYLNHRYPEKYYLYKWGIYRDFANLIGYDMVDYKTETEKLEDYFDLCNMVLDAVNKDEQLKSMSRARLTEDCYQDDNYHILAMDIVYFGGVMEKLKIDIIPPETESMTDVPKNVILYGPPGTGKTYNSIKYAVAIIENKNLEDVMNEEYSTVAERYHLYKKEGYIEFTTFHQSYGYEEFIEGIKPIINTEEEDQGEIQYDVKPGIFKSFCEKAVRPVFENQMDIGLNSLPVIWKVSLEGTGENRTRHECMENGHIRIGWDSYGANINDETDFSISGGKTVLNAFMNKMKVGDIVLSCYSNTTIDAVGVVTGEYEWHDDYDEYKRLRKVNWIVKDIREDIVDMNNGKTMTLSSVYELSVTLADVMDIIDRNMTKKIVAETKDKNYVFIIDEINRGNISKIFGELITLIEPTKRIGQTEGIKVRLPYSQMLFGVPNNVFLIGTMNTADRSIATIDTALRRRFCFKEMLPNPKLLDDVIVGDINIGEMLACMNKRITALYDREHTIGHAYFMPLLNTPTIELLAEIFEYNIMPLLQEYFFEDYEKIRLVLGDYDKYEEINQFVVGSRNDADEVFGNSLIEFDERPTFSINRDAFHRLDAYRIF